VKAEEQKNKFLLASESVESLFVSFLKRKRIAKLAKETTTRFSFIISAWRAECVLPTAAGWFVGGGGDLVENIKLVASCETSISRYLSTKQLGSKWQD